MKQLFHEYLSLHPDETERLAVLTRFMDETKEAAQLIDRKNFNGHITASGFVLSPDGKKLAVVHHLFLQRFLQPGGHVDPSDPNTLEAARREVREETGIGDCVHLPARADFLLPFDIDSHAIPANPKKGEPGHYHHDFRYLFQAREEIDPSQFQVENEARWTWRPFEIAVEEPSFQFVVKKLKARGKR